MKMKCYKLHNGGDFIVMILIIDKGTDYAAKSISPL